jgi:hypothetical protein
MKAFKTMAVSVGAIAALLMVAWPASASHPECPGPSCTPADQPLDFELSADKVLAPDTPLGANIAYRGASLGGAGHDYVEDSVAFTRTNNVRCKQWVSDEGAVFALNLPAQTVTATIRFIFPNAIDQVTVRAGKFSGTFGWGGEHGPLSAPGPTDGPDPDSLADQTVFAFNVPYAGQDFAVGDKIAFEVCVRTVASNSAVMLTDHGDSVASFLSSPAPPWPTPELGTIALSALGLAGVGGIGLVTRNVRRRQ